VFQVEAQKGETRAAMETLIEADQEMESVHFEKRQLIAQWNSSLLAISRREEALAAIKESIRQQDEQERSITNEVGRFKKDIKEQQVCLMLPCIIVKLMYYHKRAPQVLEA
jgi:coiled-coil domain-containing protein 40